MMHKRYTSIPDQEAHVEEMLADVEVFQPGIRARYEARRKIDPAYALSVLAYTAQLYSRPNLDRRTRFLVMTGQFTMARRPERLRETIVGACLQKLDMREVLEVMLQCTIYGGESILDEPLAIFATELGARGLLGEVTKRALKPGQRSRERSLEAEKQAWHPDDAADPRTEELMAKYGWEGVSLALVLRPKHTLNNATFLGSLDEEYTNAFYNANYSQLYGRQILDHKTRLLCMVGNTLAIGEIVQSRHHMLGAMRQGATPREVLEVLFQSVVTIGHPNVVPERIKDLVKIVEEEGLSF